MNEEIEALIAAAIKPYEQIITELEQQQKLKDAEIIVSATGVPGLVKGSDVSKGAIVIDVGIHRLVDSTEGTRIVGDVCFDDVRQKALAISPVHGGVGPMTIAFLLKNCLKAYMLQRS